MKIETPTFHIDVILYTVNRCFRSNLKIGKNIRKLYVFKYEIISISLQTLSH